ncbi:carbonic anhydrase 2-like [Watersipora subatra]|uniref:carbonic anhydrase 2-like n=1 Tax=Watersipora subatra TaxID=2589382 RepID=UPI00355B8A4F
MATFGYRDNLAPCNWGKLNESWKISDAGKKQSPIDISTSCAEQNASLSSLKYNWQSDADVRLVNNGHSPTWSVTPGKHTLLGGNLQEAYELVQFHIHFSNEQKHGCEHTIDGKSHHAEIHFVHYKKSYGSFGAAVKHGDGLAVVGAFLDVTSDGNEHKLLSSDIEKLTQIETDGSSQTVEIDLKEYQLPTEKYFTYSGSLTTPGCNECVIWIVLDQPVLISQRAYDSMGSMRSCEGGLLAQPGNFRPVQPIHGRTVFSSFDPKQIISFN